LPKFAILLCSLLFLAALGARSAAAAPNAVIQNDAGYVDTLGYYHVVGEVKNTGDVWLQSILVSAMLKDESGETVDVKQGSPWLMHLPPQISVGFDVIETDLTKSAMIRSYALSFTYQTGKPLSVLLEIENLTSTKNSVGWLQVQGNVANVGDSVSDNTVVTGTFYGSDGRVVCVTFTSLIDSTISPGTSQPFTLTIVDSIRSNLVRTYSVAAESVEYTSVPELPWQPTIITGVVLVLSLFVLGKRPKDLWNY
jgi:hypothetical protein